MIEEAIKIAKRSSTGKYMMGAVIMDRHGNILSNGWSHVPEMRRWPFFSLHAEMHALARGRHLDLDGKVCYIAAVSKKSGNVTSAMPCLHCAIALLSAGIREVYFTLNKPPYCGIMDLNGSLRQLKVYNFQ